MPRIAVSDQIRNLMLLQRGYLFPWVPACLAIGIAIYFSLRFEPPGWAIAGCAALALIVALMAWRAAAEFGPILWLVALTAAGFSLAGFRAHNVADQVISWRYYGPIEGRIIAIDRSASNAVRITLDRVILRNLAPDRTPGKVRISLHGDGIGVAPEPGLLMMTTGYLSPPSGPVEPGGFDFQRHAWFQGLGAIGYTRVPIVALAAANEGRSGLQIFAARMGASTRVQQVLKGDVGGFAAAISTGDRGGISQAALAALRASNLAHLLAISGLHMGLLAGFVFAAFRIGFALIPYVALRWPTRKISAALALIVAAGYLTLSGGNVATQRAFIMVAVALGAIMAERRAFSLRAVAMAAVIVLSLRPEALMGPGFQMSFAATTALVAVFEWVRNANLKRGPKWARPIFAVILSSVVAGAATAPFGAAHFNTLSHYGLIANLLSVPLMGVLVIPAAVLAVFLAPFGLEAVGLWIMGLGLRWILGVAHWVAGLDGAQSYVPGPAPAVLPMIALGFLFLVLWQGRVKWVGIAPIIAAFVLWFQVERPVLLIADTGGLVGVITEQGRALSKPRGAGFIALNWLENDGDGATQEKAAARWRGGVKRARKTKIDGVDIIHLVGKKAGAGVVDCLAGEIVVLSVAQDQTGPCDVYDPPRLRQTGSVAFFLTNAGLQAVTAKDITGVRLWNTPPQRRSKQWLNSQK